MMGVRMEVWKPVKGYEGLYLVSNFGRIYGIKSKRMVAQCVSKQGYYRVMLWKDNKSKHFQVHRIVAIAFLKQEPGKDQVNHKDENKLNNRVDNLEWCDQIYNTYYGTRLERLSKALTNNPKKSKPVCAFDENGNQIYEFPSVMEAQRQLGLYHCSIRDCIKGRNGVKKVGGYIWRFKKDCLPQEKSG